MSTNYLLNVNYLTTVNYLLTVGRGNIVTTGRLATPPTLPLVETTVINNIELVMLDEAPQPYNLDAAELLIQDMKDKLEISDTLTICYSNQEILDILDEWVEDYKIPENQREEIWTSTGLQDIYVYFENAEDEHWHWLVDAQVDYYDDNGRPVPFEFEEDEQE